MTAGNVTIARVYNLEGHEHFDQVLRILHDSEHIAGVTVLRGIAGYGIDGEVRTSSLLTLSLELPVIIEFYDSPEKVTKAIQTLKATLGLKHIVSWSAVAE